MHGDGTEREQSWGGCRGQEAEQPEVEGRCPGGEQVEEPEMDGAHQGGAAVAGRWAQNRPDSPRLRGAGPDAQTLALLGGRPAHVGERSFVQL